MPGVTNPVAELDQELESVVFLFVDLDDAEEELLALEKDKIPEFIDQLNAIPCYMIMNDPPLDTSGETIKLSLADDDRLHEYCNSQGRKS